MALPPKIVIRSVKFFWNTLWQVMMQNLAPRDASGNYLRPDSTFRNTLNTDRYPVSPGRYFLFIGYSCPWAHRTLIVRSLKGLETVIPVKVVRPSPEEGIWMLEEKIDTCTTLPALYQRSQPGYQGRATVPVLWDSHSQRIVNNESAEIIVLLNGAFQAFAQQPNLDLYPSELVPEIDRWNEKIYATVNNGVYRCGFAQTQEAYNFACTSLFDTLDAIESCLSRQRYLCGDRLTLADVRLFTTLIRFDIVYFSLFKCDRRRIQDYPNLGGYVRDIYQLPGVAATCRLAQIKQDYFGNLFPLNPGGIIPTTPDEDYLQQPHDRERKFCSANQ